MCPSAFSTANRLGEQAYLTLGDDGQTVKPKSDYMNKYLSSLDRNRFGIVTVKAEGLESPKDVDECIFFSQHHNAELLIARLDATKLEAAQRIEAIGAILCDTLIYYELRCRDVKSPAGSFSVDQDAFQLREMKAEDQLAVIDIARKAFSGYFGHYHSDSRLNKRDCDDTYVSWCENIARNIGEVNKIIVAEDAEGICGFLIMKVHSDNRLELVLSGVAKRIEGRGVYRRMIQKGTEYAAAAGLKRVFTSTQIINLAVQRVWIAQGFFPVKFEHTFHKWFRSNIKAFQAVTEARYG
jgi:ribosomal protein S18 acetylase RimI-like enzyme